MKNSILHANNSAISEVVGAVLLLLIAIIVFTLIYYELLPVPLPPPEPNVKLMGYTTDDGSVVIEHVGGEALSSYEIFVDGELVYQNIDGDTWEFSENSPPNLCKSLVNETDQVRVTVYALYPDGSRQVVFDGIITGVTKRKFEVTPQFHPMLISSLRTDTSDEDLICFNHTITPAINATSYIYNWMVNGEPFAELLMSFDTANDANAKDYTGNGHDGTIVGNDWTNEGLIGGAYHFDGAGDFITIDLPTVFDNLARNDFTISIWLKSENVHDDHRVALQAGEHQDFTLIFQHGTEIHFGVCENGVKRAVRSETLANNTWYHIAAVWDASEKSLTLYVNGTSCTKIGYRNYPVGVQKGLDLGHGTASSRFWLGYMDEFQVYDQTLSVDQIHQIYLSSKEGYSNKSVIVSDETRLGNIWQCIVTPNDGIQDGTPVASNTLEIVTYEGGE